MNDYTTTQLIKLLKTTKGKAFTTMAGTDILIEIVKADMIYTLTKMGQHSTIGWTARITEWGIHIECNGY
jgi:hypothetical protein